MRRPLSPLFAGRLRRRPRQPLAGRVCPHAMNPTESQHGTGEPRRGSRAILVLTVLVTSEAFCFATRQSKAEDQGNARLQSLVNKARLAQLEWEAARDANRKVPGVVSCRELRQLELQRERTELEVKVVRTQETDYKTLLALNIRRAILDLKLAQLEIELRRSQQIRTKHNVWSRLANQPSVQFAGCTRRGRKRRTESRRWWRRLTTQSWSVTRDVHCSGFILLRWRRSRERQLAVRPSTKNSRRVPLRGITFGDGLFVPLARREDGFQ